MVSVDGIHHVTAFADDPQENYDFFVDVLGLRFVKRTVRFDVPEKIYHLYYGDEMGTPGTVITYFPMTNMEMERGLVGKGQMSSTGLTIPEGSVEYWQGRLEDHDVDYETSERFGETAIEFTDPDGVPYELVTGESDIEPWDGGDVPTEHGVRGMHSVTIHSNDPAGTFDVLETMGWERVGRADHPQAGDRVRYEAPVDTPRANKIDVLIRPNAPQGVMGIGTYLHVAFRVENEWEQKELSDTLRNNGYITTSKKDRDYFQSRYITEPGGAIFEYATNGPGFTLDETPEEFGQQLRVPAWLDVDIERIEEMLPDLQTR
ncbi:diguanylate cyclase [Haloprofundus marisrubri]|uniref:Diguanylate cyclase n=1 Tax=Haloprofundus marisrubri TaxID=1514971 RepID=A0A0W1R6N6_9EURY|nr:VOC family protein [Haloprofundus marisrubri]KTG08927.1 diguanylate cyclase [Haloprofundus marisrubri]